MKSIRFLSLLLLLNLFAAGGYAADHPVKKEIAVSVLTQPHFHLAREERLELFEMSLSSTPVLNIK